MNNTEHQLNNEKTQERFRQEQESQKNLERIQELEKKLENEKSENESLKNRSKFYTSVLLNLIGIVIWIYGIGAGGTFFLILGALIVIFGIFYSL